jgi:hypothetical protein
VNAAVSKWTGELLDYVSNRLGANERTFGST